MKTEEIIDILEFLVGCCIMKPKDSEKFLKEAANSIMDLPISKEECANYARSKAVTDGEIEEQYEAFYSACVDYDDTEKGRNEWIKLTPRELFEWMREQQGEGEKELQHHKDTTIVLYAFDKPLEEIFENIPDEQGCKTAIEAYLVQQINVLKNIVFQIK